MASQDASVFCNNQSEILRPLAHFPNGLWDDRFSSFTLEKEVYDTYAKEIGMLKEAIRSMIMGTESTTKVKLNLIDTIERLGISYHFEKEIEHQLEQIFNLHPNFEEDSISYDLFTVALHFRILRQHGFNISDGIFNHFKGENGKFKLSLNLDIRGLLSLYEAAQVMTHEDSILEEALAFTKVHLKYGSLHTNSSLAKQVNYALEQPLHKGIPRLEARHYISIYEEDESNNQLLLRFAKLDYNLLQMLHKQELSQLLRWGKELEIEFKLPYSRARIVESNFFALSIFFEPQYSLGRMILAKTAVLTTIVDDTYDAYGTLDELETFTNALERWDANEIDQLPSYMKTSYMALLNLAGELETEFTSRGKSYALQRYKEEWKRYARTSYIQSQWFLTGDLPTFPDYLSNGLITGLAYILMPSVLLAMECGTKDMFDWLSNDPKVLVACAKFCRLSNDVGSYEREKQSSATAIECYMKYYNVSEQEAMKNFEEICEDARKDINEEFLRPTAVSREILMRFINLTRVVDALYKHREDGFTNPQKVIERYVIAMLVDPIIV